MVPTDVMEKIAGTRQESTKEIVEAIRDMQRESDERVEKWLNRADQYMERMR